MCSSGEEKAAECCEMNLRKKLLSSLAAHWLSVCHVAWVLLLQKPVFLEEEDLFIGFLLLKVLVRLLKSRLTGCPPRQRSGKVLVLTMLF